MEYLMCFVEAAACMVAAVFVVGLGYLCLIIKEN